MDVNTSQSVLSSRMAAVPAIKQKQVYKRVFVDAATALTAALTVSPIVAALDKAVVESATKHEPLLKSIRSSFSSILRNPYLFFTNPAFRPMLLLYGGTYFAANASDTFHSVTEDLPAQSTESTVTKLCTVTSVNLGLSLYKDAQFAKSFGPASALAIPLASYLPFIVRDCITLSASFHLPAEIAPALPEAWDRYMSRATIAQLTAPALSQWAATPLHLLALDLHARRGHLPVVDRFRKVASFWASASTTRMFRVIPAYGFGAVVNNKLRAHLMSGLSRQ